MVELVILVNHPKYFTNRIDFRIESIADSLVTHFQIVAACQAKLIACWF